jgi:hypothetical protein
MLCGSSEKFENKYPKTDKIINFFKKRLILFGKTCTITLRPKRNVRVFEKCDGADTNTIMITQTEEDHQNEKVCGSDSRTGTVPVQPVCRGRARSHRQGRPEDRLHLPA